MLLPGHNAIFFAFRHLSEHRAPESVAPILDARLAKKGRREVVITLHTDVLSRFLASFKEAPRPAKHPRRSPVLALAMAVLAFSMVVLPCFSTGNLHLDVLIPLLKGFAPLLGLMALIVILAVLYSIFFCSVLQIFTGGDDNAVPEGDVKKKWRVVRNHIFPPLTTLYLSLKEHSPPALQASLPPAH